MVRGMRAFAAAYLAALAAAQFAVFCLAIASWGEPGLTALKISGFIALVGTAGGIASAVMIARD
jgi:hypothetical protein